MRLIDADVLKQTVGSYNPVKYTYEYGYVITVEDIDSAPTVDAVSLVGSAPTADFEEGVRCKDCKYHEDGGVPGRVRCPHIVGHWVDADWYCADAKRKETENGSI